MKAPEHFPPIPSVLTQQMLEQMQGDQLMLLIVRYGVSQVQDSLEGVPPSEEQM